MRKHEATSPNEASETPSSAVRRLGVVHKKQEARLQELINLARHRYLDAGGDPRRCPSGRKHDDYMTDEERQEAMMLMRQIAGVRIIGNEIHCQGRTWNLSVATVKQG